MNDENADGTRRIGMHTLRFEPPDVVVFRANGDISFDEVRVFVQAVNEFPRPDKGFFYLSNLTNFGTQTIQAATEIRKLHRNTLRATAVVGAGFRQKILVDVLIRAGRFLGLQLTEQAPIYVGTEDEAYAWFDKLRGEEVG